MTPIWLTFRDGSPVGEGELQEWLRELRADPEIDDEEFAVAVGMVKSIRARLN